MNRSFKGVWIPKKIWLSEKLTLQEKVFLVEIDSLDNENGCYASNGHFSKFFNLSKNRCSEIINSLEKKGFISIKYIRNKGNKSIKKRVINILDKSNRGIREIDRPIRKVEEGYSGKCEESNTKSSNTVNNTKEYIYTLFKYWNEKNIIKHRDLNQQMKSHINARLKDYSVDELKKAIDNFATVLQSDDYYWTHKWTLQDFMRPNNVTRFVDDADPLNNFKSTKTKTGVLTNDPRNYEDATGDYGIKLYK